MDPKPGDTMLHIISYDIPIKYLCPPALLGLLLNQIIFDATQYDNGYADLPNWMHGITGGIVLGIMILSLFTFAVNPGFWDKLGVDETVGVQVAHYPVRRRCPTDFVGLLDRTIPDFLVYFSRVQISQVVDVPVRPFLWPVPQYIEQFEYFFLSYTRIGSDRGNPQSIIMFLLILEVFARTKRRNFTSVPTGSTGGGRA